MGKQIQDTYVYVGHYLSLADKHKGKDITWERLNATPVTFSEAVEVFSEYATNCRLVEYRFSTLSEVR